MLSNFLYLCWTEQTDEVYVWRFFQTSNCGNNNEGKCAKIPESLIDIVNLYCLLVGKTNVYLMHLN